MRAATCCSTIPPPCSTPRVQMLHPNRANKLTLIQTLQGREEGVKKERNKKLVIEGVWRRFNWGQSPGAGCCCHLQRSRQPVPRGSGVPRTPLAPARGADTVWAQSGAMGFPQAQSLPYTHPCKLNVFQHNKQLRQRWNRRGWPQNKGEKKKPYFLTQVISSRTSPQRNKDEPSYLINAVKKRGPGGCQQPTKAAWGAVPPPAAGIAVNGAPRWE